MKIFSGWRPGKSGGNKKGLRPTPLSFNPLSLVELMNFNLIFSMNISY